MVPRSWPDAFLRREVAGKCERAIVDWGYNAWGGKYPPFDLDDAVPQHVARLRKLPLFSPGIVMEGGSIDVNGEGTLLTTTSCLLHPNRNPSLNKSQIEHYLREFLGVEQILWLGDGIVGDDTDGHIDDLARFVNPSTIVTMVEDNTADENHAILQENLERLRGMRDPQGHPFRIVTLPMPAPIEYRSQRLPASYANFYIANGVVVVPTFGAVNDRIALDILQGRIPRPPRCRFGFHGVNLGPRVVSLHHAAGNEMMKFASVSVFSVQYAKRDIAIQSVAEPPCSILYAHIPPEKPLHRYKC